MRQARANTAFILTILLWLPGGHAAAQQRVAPVKKPVQVPVCDGGGAVEIKVHPSLITTIEVPLPSPRTYTADSERFTYWVDKHLVRIRPYHTAKPGDVTSAEIEVGTEWLSFKLRVVDDPDLVEVRWQLVVNPALCARVLPSPRWHATLFEGLKRARQHVLMATARAQMHREQRSYGMDSRVPAHRDNWQLEDLVPRKVVKFGHALNVEVIRAKWNGLDLWLWVDVRNRTVQPCGVRDALVALAHQQVSGRLDLQWSPAEFAQGHGGAILPAGANAQLRMIVPGATIAGRSIALFQLSLVGSDGAVSGAQVDGWDMIPIGPEEMDDWRREKEARRQDREAAGRVTLAGVGMVGLLWVPDPSDDKSLDVTTMLGAGARIEYGFNRNLAVWGEGIGARSGRAEFGEVTRQATLGRASVGGMVKIGYKTITTVRLGIGVQGMSSDSGDVGPEIPFEVSFVGSLALGIDVQLDSLMAGIAAAYDQMLGAESRALLLGAHLGFSWKP